MDLNFVLILIVSLSCALLFFRASRFLANQTQGWLFVSSFLLASVGITVYSLPHISGFIVGLLWLLLILIPSIGSRILGNLFYQEKYGQASQLASFLRWLHPFDGWWEQPEIFHALNLVKQGNFEGGMQILNPYQTLNNSRGRTATTLVYRMTGKWDELRTWMEINFSDDLLLKELSLIVYKLRALGETGDLNGLLNWLIRCEPILEKMGDVINLNLVRMFALAFCGYVEPVEKLLNGTLGMYSPDIKQFWLATAKLAASPSETTQAELKKQLKKIRDRSSDFTLKNSIAWRLSHPVFSPTQTLTPTSQEILSRIATDVAHEHRYGKHAFTGRKPFATYSLIALNLFMFALEIHFGGSENFDSLYRLGALVPEVVWGGEWWRLLSATFLHFGFTHLFMNMFALYIIGAFVEFSLGIWNYLGCYFFSGVGSMLVVTLLAMTLEDPAQIVVGASGAIMGLIGATGAILLWGWRLEKARVAGKRFRSILFIIGLQVVFDLAIPEVCFICHASGVVLGFLMTTLLLFFKFLTNKNRSSASMNSNKFR